MSKIKTLQNLSENFLKPFLILMGIGVYGILRWMNYDLIGIYLLIFLIFFGSYQLFIEIFQSLRRRQFALDYIALGAVLISLYTHQWLVGAVIALMLATGQNLESYAVLQAKKSLTALIDRIPDEVIRWINQAPGNKVKISSIEVGQEIFVRKGEVIPLDGTLMSENALTDESSLTGEPYFFEKFTGDQVRSGTVNIGEPIVIQVTKKEADSTYKKIIGLVQEAQGEKAPMIRLADRYSTFFSLITLALCLATYGFTRDIQRVLAVLVIATPCPLILATPIALMGGVNASAKRRIIIKKLASLEVLSRINSIILDKTGTITMGRPKISQIELHSSAHTEDQALALSAAIERSSLHPLAKAIVEAAKAKKVHLRHAKNVKEIVGKGISGEVEGKTYELIKQKDGEGMAIDLIEAGQKLATFHFEDEIKQDTIATLHAMKAFGMETYMYTGDKQKAADEIAKKLGVDIVVKAECTPEDKQKGIKELKAAGKITAMVGDGINDAPALALADIGMVFSNEEQTASSEAADIIFLGGDFNLVLESITISKRTVKIAIQSIYWGIGLSLIGMTFASFGYIVPVVGAVIQELIDVVAIVNSLRASK